MKQATRWAIAGTSLGLLGLPMSAWADGIVPAADGTGTQVNSVGGNHTITGGTVSGDQQNLFHSFSEFNVLTGESATFLADPAILNILSRVNGGNASIIDGLLQVSGGSANLFLINPNGILFGENAVLNLQGSFTATTADQVNFATGAFGAVGSPDYSMLIGDPTSFSFTLEALGSVVNGGSLSVPAGETVMLLGGQVLNTGTITAPGGEVVISAVAGGNLVRIEQSGTLLNLELEAIADSAVDTALPFTPLALPELLTGRDAARATGVTVNPDGTVQLASGVPVNPDAGATTVSGTVDVSATQGGQVLVLGDEIGLAGAAIAATGETAGGTVNVGGDYQGQGTLPAAQTVYIDADSVIAADALGAGNGGTVVVWADGDTTFQGQITARGGTNGGDGGLVETSGLQTIAIAGGSVDASAAQGAAGLWFVDPSNITIEGDLAFTIESTLAGGTSFTASTIDGDVTDAPGDAPGDGDILFASDINATATNNATLTLTASRYIDRAPGADFEGLINITDGNLVLNVNQEGLADAANPTLTNTLDRIGNVTGTTKINLGPGTYEEGGAIVLDQDLTLAGAGVENTTLSGQDAHRVALVAEGSTVTIRDLVIANGAIVGDDGGGILNRGDLTIADANITGNDALADPNFFLGGSGGGIANQSAAATLTLTDVVIDNNGAETEGGGIFNEGGTVILTATEVRQNAVNGPFARGGGISNAGGTVTLSDSAVTQNAASSVDGMGDLGGGISNRDLAGEVEIQPGILTIADSVVSDNTAAAGGGLQQSATGAIAIDNSTFSNNTATGDGGGISSTGPIAITTSTFSGNTAEAGGAIFNSAALTIANSTFSDNTATGNGGGFSNVSSNAAIANSTFSGNSAAAGGGVYHQTSVSSDGIVSVAGSLAIASSLLSGNTAPTGPNLFSDGAFTSNGNNLFGSSGEAGVTGAMLTASDIVPIADLAQILQPTLADNGGPTPTLALLPGSPAINAGSGTDADQRGVAVVENVRDIGAFESQGFTLTASEGTPQITGISQPFGAALTVIVSSAFGEPVAGGTVTFAAPTSGAGATLSSDRVILNGDGTASVSAIANETGGSYTVTATLSNTTTAATFDLTNLTEDEVQIEGCVSGECRPQETERVRQPQRQRDQNGEEAAYVQEFEDFLAVEAFAFADVNALNRAEALTGVPPALLYANFVPPTDETVVASAATKALSDPAPGERQASEIAQAAPTNLVPSGVPEEVLELVLVTGDGETTRINTGAPRSEVVAAVRQLHREVTDRTRRRFDNYLIPAQALYGWLVAPLEDVLTAAEIGHISFILDQGLRSLPLATLHDGNQFIIEQYSVGLMPSLTLTDTRIGNIRNASVLAMGASEFEALPPLPGVPFELATIESLWPGEEYLNEAFTPTQVVESRTEEAYPILHLATHGQFRPGTLSNSYIQFWDRRLGLDELPELQLSQPAVELLILSACRTVLGDAEAELGFAGLAIKSGAKSAIAALWQVSDLETAGLMAELYTHLGQATYKAEALRQAQLSMLQGEVTVQNGTLFWSGGQADLPPNLANLRFADTSHPFYWSAFTLVGNPW